MINIFEGFLDLLKYGNISKIKNSLFFGTADEDYIIITLRSVHHKIH